LTNGRSRNIGSGKPDICWIRLWITAKKKGKDTRFIDIRYQDLIKDSVEELGRIYNLNGGMTPELIERFGMHEKEHPHRKYGKHEYSLADFGLTENDIDQHTMRYKQFIKKHYEGK